MGSEMCIRDRLYMLLVLVVLELLSRPPLASSGCSVAVHVLCDNHVLGSLRGSSIPMRGDLPSAAARSEPGGRCATNSFCSARGVPWTVSSASSSGSDPFPLRSMNGSSSSVSEIEKGSIASINGDVIASRSRRAPAVRPAVNDTSASAQTVS